MSVFRCFVSSCLLTVSECACTNILYLTGPYPELRRGGFYAVSKAHSHLGGSGGMLPPKIFDNFH